MQFIADDSQMYNLQTQLRSTVIDSWMKVTLCFCACVPVCVCVLFFSRAITKNTQIVKANSDFYNDAYFPMDVAKTTKVVRAAVI